MKRLLPALALVASVSSGCYAGMGAPIPGLLFAQTKSGKLGTASTPDVKTGTATCESILGLIATGDCSIEAAKRNGGLQNVQYTDIQVKNILGVYATYTTIAKGN
jgi:TRL-like protein family